MDGHGHHNNDWDLFAVVRSCRNNNGNSSSSSNSNAQDGNPHHCFINGEQLSNAETRHGEFPNLLPERRYFGLDEVLDRFINRKQQEEEMTPQIDNKDESPQITMVSPTLTPKVQHGKSGSAKEVTVVEVAVEKVEEWDGWLWRKYGKKKVCDSPHTKSYYRCSFEGHKCPAKKHIQQSQRDESKFIVTYRGQHNHFPPVPSNTTKRRKRNNAPPASPYLHCERCEGMWGDWFGYQSSLAIFDFSRMNFPSLYFCVASNARSYFQPNSSLHSPQKTSATV